MQIIQDFAEISGIVLNRSHNIEVRAFVVCHIGCVVAQHPPVLRCDQLEKFVITKTALPNLSTQTRCEVDALASDSLILIRSPAINRDHIMACPGQLTHKPVARK